MASYERVPRDENETEAQATMQDEGRAITSNLKQQSHTYEQVALEEDAHPPSFRDRLSGLCIQPLLLVGLAVFFAAATLTVGLLYHFSQVNIGLTTEDNSHRYAWLYGPTATVVLVRVIWRVFDLKIKETMPWHELAHGPSPATKTVLLEYLSPSLLPSIWSSIKNRHWPVTIAIAGQSLLLLSTVFTTGLFTLEATVIVVDNVSLRTNRFNGSAFDVNKLDASAALLNLAIQTQNLSFPKGTTSDTVVPLFDSDPQYPADAVTQAVVKGVKVSFDCETLNVTNATKTYLPWYSIRAPQFVINITTPSCTILNARIGTGPNHGVVLDPNATQTYQGWINSYVCNSGLDVSQPWGSSILPQWKNDTKYLKSLDRKLDDRVVVSVVDFHYLPQKVVAEIGPQWVNRLTALLCKPSYEINEYRVDSARNTTTTTMEFVRKTDETLDNFYSGDMSKSIRKVFSDYGHLYIGMGGVDYQFTSDAAQPFGQMMSLLHGGEKTNFTLKDLMEPDVLNSSAQAIMKGTLTQILHQKVMTAMSDSYDENLKGKLSYTKDRLHVRAVAAGCLCACFILLFIFAIVLFFIAPQKPNIQGTIGSTKAAAVALQSNQVLRQVFLTTQPKRLKANLTVEFFSRPQPHTGTVGIDFVPVADKVEGNSSHASSHASENDGGDQTPVEWWRPAMSRSWYTVLVIILCAIIIGVLEGIQQISDKRDGFINIRPNSVNSTIRAQFIPAAVVLSIALMFADMEKMVATFSPFATLKKGNAVASRTLTLNYLTQSGPHAFFLSIKNRHFALSVALITTFVGSFLAIVVPGLYSQVTIPAVSSISLNKADRFTFKNVDISLDDKRAGAVFNLLTYYDIGYPIWTYDDLVFPKLNPENMELAAPTGANSSSTTLTMRTTALRPRLTCQSLSDQSVWKGQPNGSIVEGTIYFPWSLCSNAPANLTGNGTTPWSLRSFKANDTIIPKQSYYFGQGGVMRWGLDYYSGPRNRVAIENAESEGGLNPSRDTLPEWGCPSLAFSLGSATFSSSSRNSSWIVTAAGVDINTIACWQNLQTVETDVILEYPSMTFVKDSPPRPDEETSKWLKNQADSRGGTAFQFFNTNMFISLNSPNISSTVWAKGDSADRFTQALVYTASKEDGLNIKDLAGVANSDKFIKQVQRLYARYMVQAISNNMRVGLAENASSMAVTDALWTATASPVFVPTPSPSSIVRNRPASNTTIWLAPDNNSTQATNSGGFIKPTSVPKSTANPTLTPAPASTGPFNPIRKRADANTLPATLTQTGAGAHVRLKQNRGPKIALQVMLGVMIAGALAQRVLLHTNETLQREPYSIAGRAVLVANGNILETMDVGGHENVVLDGRLYRLGWWVDREGKKRYGITVDR